MTKRKQSAVVLSVLVILLTSVIPFTGVQAEQTGVVKGGWLILRSAPSFNGTIKSSYPSGTVVTITGQVGSWYAVTAPDGLSGYMLGDYLQVSGGGSVPAESAAYKLARFDRRLYPGIITAGGEGGVPYYTNSSHLGVDFTDDVFEALNMEEPMQLEYTSGTVFHAYLGERMPDWRSAMKLVRTIARNYKLPYFTVSPVYSVCENHGYLNGCQVVCPKCGQPTEVYSRITGYYRPVKNWNAGKAQEFRDRKYFN